MRIVAVFAVRVDKEGGVAGWAVIGQQFGRAGAERQ